MLAPRYTKGLVTLVCELFLFRNTVMKDINTMDKLNKVDNA